MHYMVFYYMYKYMIVLFLIYVDNYTCRPGVPPRGLSWDQPLKVSLGFIRVSFVFYVFFLNHGFYKILLSRFSWEFMSDLGFSFFVLETSLVSQVAISPTYQHEKKLALRS